MNSADTLSASIVIATLNRPDEIQLCARSIAAQTRTPSQLVVVDAGDLGKVRDALENMTGEAGIEFVYLRDKPSTTMQRNYGVEHVDADVVFFLDDDVVLSEDYLAAVLAVYEADPDGKIGGATGVIDPPYPPSTGFWKWYAKLFLLADTREQARSRLKASNFPIHATRLSASTECEIMPSTAVSYRTDVFREFGFDSDLTGYVMAEDLDLSHRVSRSYRLRLLPEATYKHSKSSVSRNSPRQMEMRRLLFTQYFFRKNFGGSPVRYLARYWAIGGLLLRMLYIGVVNRDMGRFLGVCDGIQAASRNRLLGLRRFRPGPLTF